MKKLLSLLISFAVVISTCSFALSAFAAGAAPEIEFDYYINHEQKRAELYRYVGKSKTVVIPSELYGYPVTLLRGCFYSNNIVEKVVIADTVTTICENTFACMDKIKQITIPENVDSIMPYAFYGCPQLKNIYTNANNKTYNSVNGVLFDDCKMLVAYPAGKTATSYDIPDGTRGVFGMAFADCKALKKVTFPNSIVGTEGEYLGISLFENCTSLEAVRLAPSTRYITSGMFKSCKALASISIPGKVRAIGQSAFEGCASLKSIKIPDSVVSIDAYAFKGCKLLKSVDVPKSVNHISSHVFDKCDSLQYVRLLNPDIYIDGYWNDGLVEPSDKYNPIGSMPVIYGYKGSTAEKHAAHFKGIKFIALVNAKGYKVSVSPSYYHYDGKVKKPVVTVKDTKGNVISSSSYKVTYAAGRKNVGKYSVKVTMTGKYVGEFNRSFTIKPKKSYLTRLEASKNGFAVHWKKTSGITGYQLQYSTSKSFSNPQYITLNDKNRTGKSVKDLKGGKRYYVRVRTYKSVALDGKRTNIFSNYSKAYSVVTGK